jgi:tetratricopeptide (TPR) repeat protein
MFLNRAAAAGNADAQQRLRTLPSAQSNQEAESHYNLALAADHQGDVDKAIAEYRKALAADPNFAAAHYHLDRVLKDTGQEQAAEKEFAAGHGEHSRPRIPGPGAGPGTGRRPASLCRGR